MRTILLIIAILLANGGSAVDAQTSDAVSVTVDNFIRAESDLYLGNAVKDAGGTGKFGHRREPVPIDKQSVIRSNRDTLYSPVVINLDAGPATVTLPEAGDRFRSMQVINEDYYVVGDVEYSAYSLTNITAKKASDGSVGIQFGGCDGKIPNCLPIMKVGTTPCGFTGRARKFSTAEDRESRPVPT